jgi:prepilin peptidase CpaA
MPFAIELALVMLVALAAWSDLRTREIPNWITLPSAALGLALQIWYAGPHGLWNSVTGAALGVGILIVFFFAGGMGAGDVKLFGAVGALVGPYALIFVFVFTGILGGIVAAAVVMRRGDWRAKLPYGAVIAGGTLLSLTVIH